MKSKILKFFLYCVGTILLFYVSVWLLFQINHSFPSYFTVYSQDFNKTSFRGIQPGTNKVVVESLLGRPLRESIDNASPDSLKVVYWYSKGKYYGFAYDKIYILFYDNKVTKKIKTIDMD